MDNYNRYDTPPHNKNRIETISPVNANQMALMGQKGEMGRIRANYYNKLRTNSQLNIGGRTTKSAFKNKKNRTTLLRSRKYSKKNRRSMKRK
jgi:hypothetical protein